MGSEGRERRAEEDEGNVITCQVIAAWGPIGPQIADIARKLSRISSWRGAVPAQEPAEDQKRAERARADSEGLNDPAACEPSSFQSSQRPRSGEQPYTPKSSADKPAGTADHTSGTLDSAPASNPVSTVPGAPADAPWPPVGWARWELQGVRVVEAAAGAGRPIMLSSMQALFPTPPTPSPGARPARLCVPRPNITPSSQRMVDSPSLAG